MMSDTFDVNDADATEDAPTESASMTYEVTVDEPNTYTRPWTGGWTVQWVADQEIQEYFCEESQQ